MKKFILMIIAMLTFSVAMSAQKTLDPTIYFVEYTGVVSDTVGVGTTTWSYPLLLNKTEGLYYNAKVKVQDVAAGAACTVKLQGKYFSDDAYSDITTYTWYGGGTDTTVVFTGNTNKIYYRYLNILVTRTASKAKVNYVKLSIKK